jgi:hypothetical protein
MRNDHLTRFAEGRHLETSWWRNRLQGRSGDAPRRGWKHPHPCNGGVGIFPDYVGAALRASLVSSHSGGFGTPPGRHYDPSVRSSLDWDRATASQEARPGVGAEFSFRAKPPVERREAWRPSHGRRRASQARRISVAPFGAPLPSLCRGEREIPARPRLTKNRADVARLDLRSHCERAARATSTTVIAGLDPAIHRIARRTLRRTYGCPGQARA